MSAMKSPGEQLLPLLGKLGGVTIQSWLTKQ